MDQQVIVMQVREDMYKDRHAGTTISKGEALLRQVMRIHSQLHHGRGRCLVVGGDRRGPNLVM